MYEDFGNIAIKEQEEKREPSIEIRETEVARRIAKY